VRRPTKIAQRFMNHLRFRLFRLGPFRRLHRRTYERQAAPAFLFERRSLVHRCVDRRPGSVAIDTNERGAFLVAANQPPYCLTRREKLVLRRSEAPALTITSDPYNSVTVVGTSGPDWTISFCA